MLTATPNKLTLGADRRTLFLCFESALEGGEIAIGCTYSTEGVSTNPVSFCSKVSTVSAGCKYRP